MKHLLLTATALLASTMAYAQKSPATQPETLQRYNQQLTQQTTALFEENKGQMKDQHWLPRPDVLYYGKSEGMNYYLHNNGMSYQLSRVESWKEEDDKLKTALTDQKEKRKVPDQIGTYRVNAQWQNFNTNFTIIKGKTLEGYNNYYNVPDGVEPALFVKQYEALTLKDLWDGIDVHYYSTNGFLETDYLVAPGADYKQIQIEIKGAELSIDEAGNLILKTPFGEIREGKLKVYQNDKLLQAGWLITASENGGFVSFDIPNYNPSFAMRIDPLTRVWGTFYGEDGDDFGNACSKDDSGNVYLAGWTGSTNVIASGGHQNTYGGNYDAFLVKFNTNCVRQWSTYYGGSGEDVANSCDTDDSGNVYLAGRTNSSNAIALGGHQNTFGGGNLDAFLVKFFPNGLRQWGTYYGMSGIDEAFSCSSDPSGNVYLTGRTDSPNAIAFNGHQNSFGGGTHDVFLVKFNTNGSRQWSTYYGGSGEEYAYSCSTDANGNVFLAGLTSSTTAIASGGHQNTLGGIYDAFLVEFNTFGVRQWGTYYGGSGEDWGLTCSTDGSNNVYLGGWTESTSAIASGGHQNTLGGTRDGFLVKLNNGGVRQWGTYYGGSGNFEEGKSCSTDVSGNVYLVGSTNSTNAIALGGYQNTFGNGFYDAYLVKFNSSGIRQWGTYYGGGENDLGRYCITDNSNYVYLAGQTGSLNAMASGGHQSNYGGGTWDAFLVKFIGACSTAEANLDQTACNSYTWNGETYNQNGQYTFATTNMEGCDSTAILNLTIFNFDQSTDVSFITNPVSGCEGNDGSIILNLTAATGPFNYLWSNGSTEQNVGNLMAGNYNVIISDANNCVINLTIPVNALPDSLPVAEFSYMQNGTAIELNSTATNADSLYWDFGDGNGMANIINPSHTYAASGTYETCLTAYNNCGSNTFCDTVNTIITGLSMLETTSFSLSPNPNNGQFMIRWSASEKGRPNFIITDALGKNIKYETQSTGAENWLLVTTSKLSAGLYFYSFSLNHKPIANGRWVKY